MIRFGFTSTSGNGEAGAPARAARARSGFSLVELLAVLAILALVGSVAATGIPVAMKAYKTAVDLSNAQLLMSTSVDRLRDELSVADPATVDDRSVAGADGSIALVTYSSLETGYRTQVVFKPGEGLYLREAAEAVGGGAPTSDPVDTRLVPAKAAAGATGSFVVELASGAISYDDAHGVFTVSDLKVARADGSEFADVGIDEFSVSTIADAASGA